jgi:hypothetical protein
MASCNLPGPSGNAVILQNGAVRIVDQASLAGKTPCSEGRGGLDRWCVFFKQKQSATRGQDVWAVNVSRIGRGENVQCNQPSPACVEVATGDHVVHWGFVADTLVIDGVPPGTSVSARVSAPVTAWRPDWESAVAVTSNPVSGCWVDVATESVACVERCAGGLDASAADSRERRRLGGRTPGRCRAWHLLRGPPYPEPPRAHRGSARTRAGSGAFGERQFADLPIARRGTRAPGERQRGHPADANQQPIRCHAG